MAPGSEEKARIEIRRSKEGGAPVFTHMGLVLALDICLAFTILFLCFKDKNNFPKVNRGPS